MDITFDSTLTSGSNNEEEIAFTAVFNSYYVPLCFYAQRLIQDAEKARDIVSEVFSKLWANRADFSNDAHIKNTLYHSVRNICYNFTRDQKSALKKNQRLQYVFQSEKELPEEFLFKSELEEIRANIIQRIYLEIENLPEQCKKVFKMWYLEGLPYETIAQKLKISAQTARNHKTKAIGLIKRKIITSDLFTASAIAVGTAVLVSLAVLILLFMRTHGVF